VLRRLSVFAGGWTLETAEAVCTEDGVDVGDVLDLLTQLVNKSLVTVECEQGEAVRYRLLETTRQYAREKLAESGEGQAVRGRHLDYYLELAERIELQFRTS
jgi:predicted ATPase